MVMVMMCAFSAGEENGIFVHAVQEALDHAKGDEASDVDPVQHCRVLDAKVPHALAVLQRTIQLHQFRAAEQVPTIVISAVAIGLVWHGDVARALALKLGAADEVGQLGRRGVDGREAEDVEQEDAAIIEEVRERLADELVVGVGREGDLSHAIDAIDVREDEQHGKVPVWVHEGGEPHSAEGHVVWE